MKLMPAGLRDSYRGKETGHVWERQSEGDRDGTEKYMFQILFYLLFRLVQRIK